MSNYPKISIITPSFNQGKFLEKTICSVLEQGYPNLEYIIIDGRSKDESVEIIKKYERNLAYWVSEPDRGQSHAINKGFARATGDIFGWLNSDDWYHPGALHAVAEAFANNPGVGAVVGAGEMVDETGNVLLYKGPFDVTTESLYCWIDNWFWQPSCFFTRAAWEQCGPLKEELYFAMDLDLWLRIAARFEFGQIRAMLSTNLRHDNAKTTALGYASYAEAAGVVIANGGLVDGLRYMKNLAEHLSKSSQELHEQGCQIAACEDQIADLTRQITTLQSTLSWKLTAPLRKLGALLAVKK